MANDELHGSHSSSIPPTSHDKSLAKISFFMYQQYINRA